MERGERRETEQVPELDEVEARRVARGVQRGERPRVLQRPARGPPARNPLPGPGAQGFPRSAETPAQIVEQKGEAPGGSPGVEFEFVDESRSAAGRGLGGPGRRCRRAR